MNVISKIQWNPLDVETIANPYPAYRHMLETEPIFWHDALNSWVVASYADCREVLRDHRRFARDRRRVGMDIPDQYLNIQTQDPPEQAKLRRAVMRHLHAQDIREITCAVRSDIEKRLGDLSGSGPFDFIEEIAAPSSVNFINSVFGVHHYTAQSYLPVYEALTKTMDSGLDPSRAADGAHFSGVLKASIRSWLAQPQEQGLVAAIQRDSAVSEMDSLYVSNTLAGVYNAGFSTSTASIGSAVGTLLQNPDALGALARCDSTTVATHELLRFMSPAQATARAAVADTLLGQQNIKAGDTVVTLMAAANRDPAIFDNPDELILDRTPNPHLAFAWGPHICLGAQLAVSWISEFLRFIRDNPAVISLVAAPEYLHSATLRTPTKLLVQYIPNADRNATVVR